MTRFADPTRCPDCRSALPPNPERCPVCALPLTGPLGRELLRTLRYADDLVSRLRSPVAVEPDTLSAAPLAPYPRPATREPDRQRTGLSTASVPSILLTLGALCLLVAAVTFLALAWQLMGVGGRTVVLVGLTTVAVALSFWLDRRGLRVGAEALSTVTLGMVLLDVLGAVSSGWLGDPDLGETAELVGLAVAAAAALLLTAPGRPAAPQVGLPLGLTIALVGASVATSHDVVVAVAGVLGLAALAWLGRLLDTPVLVACGWIGAGSWWVWLAARGYAEAVVDPSLHSLWTDGHGLALAAGTVLLLLPAAYLPGHAATVHVSAAAAATLLTVTLALPVVDESLTRIGVVALVALLLWSAVAALVPDRWVGVPAAPLVLSALPALGIVVGLFGEAIGRITETGRPFSTSVYVRLAPTDPLADPRLVLPLTAALLVAALVCLGIRGSLAVSVRIGGTALMLAGLATVASYDVPLGVVTGLLSAAALAVAVDAATSHGWAAGTALVGAGTGCVALIFALPSLMLTTGTAAALTAVALALVLARSDEARIVGQGLLPLALGVLLWCVGDLALVDDGWRALPVLAAVGLLAIARPRIALEVSAAGTGLAAIGAVAHLTSGDLGPLALNLTVAGALVTVSSLVHADRRPLAWAGGFLLAAATWVRLFELGVHQPEAYTLPSAVTLILVGLYRIWREPDASTELLLPGLALATVPSLLWVVAVDPVSPRAFLLGIACLGLILVGSRLDWSTPIVLGALVGSLLVLREVAPYAAAQPRWILIGLAGTLLTVVGVTWERRVVEMRQAAAYLGRLR